jgi:acyl-CoA-dependent ceramide synthase
MVFFWIVVFTGLRAAVMDYILTPLARRGGVATEKDRTRFSEQAWLLTFYCVMWPLGMVSWVFRSLIMVVNTNADWQSTS